ncbi:hypothetical protein ABKN59_006125 [Abortiporus biennis]
MLHQTFFEKINFEGCPTTSWTSGHSNIARNNSKHSLCTRVYPPTKKNETYIICIMKFQVLKDGHCNLNSFQPGYGMIQDSYSLPRRRLAEKYNVG